MSDLPKQVETSELAERLLRRHQAPVGVIDVRQPQQIHARTAGWVAQRFAMLEHWQQRYGSNEAMPSGRGELVFTSLASPLKEPASTTEVSTRAAVSPSVAPGIQPKPEATPAPLLRVSRRPVNLARSPEPANVEPVKVPTETETVQTGESNARVHELIDPTNMIHSASPLVLQTKRDELSESSASEFSETSAQAMPADWEMADRNRNESAVVAPPMEFVREAQPRLARSRELSQPVDVTAAVGLWRTSALPPANEPGSTAAQGNAPLAIARQAEIVNQAALPKAAELPLASAPAVIQRQADFETSEQPVQAERLAEHQSLTVALELQPVTGNAPTPPMVWRKAEIGTVIGDSPLDGRTARFDSPLPLKLESAPTVAPMVARQPSESLAANSSLGANLPMGAEPNPSRHGTGNGVDVAQLAGQVSRLLARQLAVERERRGMK